MIRKNETFIEDAPGSAFNELPFWRVGSLVVISFSPLANDCAEMPSHHIN